MIILDIIKIIACINILIAIFSFIYNKNSYSMLHISSLCDNMGCFIFVIAIVFNSTINLTILIKLIALIIILIASGIVSTSLISMSKLN
ncbi:MAG: monovalent cation/H(+) antiporter subunit G [Rickettsiales bacterium]